MRSETQKILMATPKNEVIVPCPFREGESITFSGPTIRQRALLEWITTVVDDISKDRAKYKAYLKDNEKLQGNIKKHLDEGDNKEVQSEETG